MLVSAWRQNVFHKFFSWEKLGGPLTKKETSAKYFFIPQHH